VGGIFATDHVVLKDDDTPLLVATLKAHPMIGAVTAPATKHPLHPSASH
jgi:hypothetical protein